MKRAKFVGWQPDRRGGTFPLFNIVTDTGEYPNGTTVSIGGLKKHGVEIPDFQEAMKEYKERIHERKHTDK